MAEIKVTTTELKNKAAELRQLNNQFKKAVEDMTNNEQQLMTMWDGDSKETFHKAYTSDIGQMEVFYQTIEAYCQVLEFNANNYDTAEQENNEIAASRTYGGK